MLAEHLVDNTTTEHLNTWYAIKICFCSKGRLTMLRAVFHAVLIVNEAVQVDNVIILNIIIPKFEE